MGPSTITPFHLLKYRRTTFLHLVYKIKVQANIIFGYYYIPHYCTFTNINSLCQQTRRYQPWPEDITWLTSRTCNMLLRKALALHFATAALLVTASVPTHVTVVRIAIAKIARYACLGQEIKLQVKN